MMIGGVLGTSNGRHSPSAAEAVFRQMLIAAVNRCATQNQVRGRVGSQRTWRRMVLLVRRTADPSLRSGRQFFSGAFLSSSAECLAAAVHWEGNAGSLDCALLRFAHSAPLRMTALGERSTQSLSG